MTALELVIEGGHVYDGTGAEAVVANVGIAGGRIAAISAEKLSAETVVDARGLAVSPGFIDLHSHADYTVERWPEATGLLAQGVTSILTGNCGWSPFPVVDAAEAKRWGGFLAGAPSWDWDDLAGFARVVGRAQPAVNILPQVGHVAVRLAAVGGAERAASAAEIELMRQYIRTAAEQGAWGFSTGLIYAPGSFASTAEINELVRVAAEEGLLYSTHMRDETSHLLEAVTEALNAAEYAGARLEISHIKAMGPANHGKVREALELLDAAVARGVDVAADVYPYTASGTTLASRLPTWALDGGFELLVERLSDPEQRRHIHAALDARFGVDFDPAGIVLAELDPGPFQNERGRSLVQIGQDLGVDAAEAALMILAAHHGNVPIINHAMDEADVETALRHPLVSVASDGDELVPHGEGATHPRSFGTFPRVLARYVRERGVLGLSDAVRKMTALPASRLGLVDRGILAVGAIADITVFDADSIADLATYDDPWQAATGVCHVLIGGRIAFADGKPVDARHGQLLLRNEAKD
ncbi:N-acyl-D-amino-acid deacylase family protein [Lysinibacter cavernae]|uniref:N-acyl-D-amino-acid deacylase n=1 Tax=Lysinibacter cavernae TaxID=1640652 RepID=A0A7X5TSD0_9MICO|nr:D-aminoacylase [Lysinibacter cavernae]NIH52239.1 N-acyl-D-amino-acid deacylase [Lysinibacter cavernae]